MRERERERELKEYREAIDPDDPICARPCAKSRHEIAPPVQQNGQAINGGPAVAGVDRGLAREALHERQVDEAAARGLSGGPHQPVHDLEVPALRRKQKSKNQPNRLKHTFTIPPKKEIPRLNIT